MLPRTRAYDWRKDFASALEEISLYEGCVGLEVVLRLPSRAGTKWSNFVDDVNEEIYQPLESVANRKFGVVLDENRVSCIQPWGKEFVPVKANSTLTRLAEQVAELEIDSWPLESRWEFAHRVANDHIEADQEMWQAGKDWADVLVGDGEIHPDHAVAWKWAFKLAVYRRAHQMVEGE